MGIQSSNSEFEARKVNGLGSENGIRTTIYYNLSPFLDSEPKC